MDKKSKDDKVGSGETFWIKHRKAKPINSCQMAW